MTDYLVSIGILGVSVCACVAEEPSTSASEQPGINMQGINMQGINMQGTDMQGMSMRGFRFDGARLGCDPLTDLRVEHGEVIAERGGVTLRGAALAGARLRAEVQDLEDSPPVTALVDFRIKSVVPESAIHDPTQTGSTFLYALEQWVDETSSWQPACAADADGRRVAIPLAATWDERGDRIESSAHFTFACTAGVIAKCYRWGYRPWVTGYGDLAEMHWTCTRLARADYCGDGVPHTYDGTLVYVWDRLPAPGPIQTRGQQLPPGMRFEAGWTTSGAVCLSHVRWLSPGWPLSSMCSDRLVPPGLGGLACNSVQDVLDANPSVRMFSASHLNVGP